MRMPDVRPDGQGDSFSIELPCGSRTPDPSAVPLAGMLRDGRGIFRKTAGIVGSDPLGEAGDVLRVGTLATYSGALSRDPSLLLIAQALLLSAFERSRFDE